MITRFSSLLKIEIEQLLLQTFVVLVNPRRFSIQCQKILKIFSLFVCVEGSKRVNAILAVTIKWKVNIFTHV